jgi:glycosyltransferase involved in cell wall biosynthesis
MPPMRTALEIVLWTTLALIVWTQLGYAAVLVLLARVLRGQGGGNDAASTAERSGALPGPTALGSAPATDATLPAVSLIVAAHDEQAVIGEKVQDALALDYPRERLEVVVACDGCADATARRAREAGADLVLELARGGKIRAQDAAVGASRGELVAFSDANSLWEPSALRELVGAFEDPRVGYACGGVRFFQGQPASPASGRGATNQEGVYWRYELAQRAAESRLCSITAGNGAIYATRRESYMVVDPVMGHDLSFPFNMVKRGWRAVYVPSARASGKMVPSIEGELQRKRRMMSHTWPIVLRGGMLDPRGYGPGYALMILSHRVLRYCTAFLHLLAFAANFALVLAYPPRGTGPTHPASSVYTLTLTLQVLLFAAAGLGGLIRVRPLLLARYYVLTTASLALGFWDWARHGTSAQWEAAEGTR